MTIPGKDLKHSARSALVWGVTFTLGRDLVQFGSMLILARLLSPEIYGQFALTQTIQIFLAVISVKTISPFALQVRDPKDFDWDLQFTAGTVLNTAVFIITLIVAGGFYVFGGEIGRTVGMVLAVMALIFPTEIIGTHYFTWLQAHHLWKRMRLLLLVGTFLGSISSIALAKLGGGVFSLAIGNLCFTLPMIFEYAVRRPFPLRFQPRRLHLYRQGREFGLNRIASGGLQTGSSLVEQSIISVLFGFSTLGVYTRAVGLAQITSGRIGPVVTQTLYPILTRAEASSDRFRRFAGILFQGVLWTSVPSAAFLALEAQQLVHLFYGDKWLSVIPLVGAAATLLSLRGLHLTMNQIMLANLQQKVCLRLDWAAAISLLTVILSTAFLGPKFYLLALSVHAALVLLGTTWFAIRGGAIAAVPAVRAIASCLAATMVAIAAITYIPSNAVRSSVIETLLSLAVHGVVFGVVYILILRLLAPKEIEFVLGALPLPERVERASRMFLNVPRGPA